MRKTITYSSPIKTALFLCLLIFITLFHESEKTAHFASSKLSEKNSGSGELFFKSVLFYSEMMEGIKNFTGLSSYYSKEKELLSGLNESPVLFSAVKENELSVNEKITSSLKDEEHHSNEPPPIVEPEKKVEEPKKLEKKEEKSTQKIKEKEHQRIRGFSPPYRFLFAGDSMVQSPLGTDLEKRLMTIKRSRVTKKGVVSSGLLRPDYFNWHDKLNRMIDIHRPNVLVIMLGTNDISALYNPFKKKFYAFNSRLMKIHYRNNVKRLMQLTRNRGLRTFWIGLPATEKNDVNEKLSVINEIHESVAAEFENVHYVKTWDLFRNDDESVKKFIISEGKKTRVRSSDGVHYSEAGGTFAGARIFRNITETIRTNLETPPVRYAEVQRVIVKSAILNEEVGLDVFIPVTEEKSDKFPLIFFFPGKEKNGTSLFKKNEKYLRWISQSRRCIIAVPHRTPLWEKNSANKEDLTGESFISEFLPFISSNYPVDGNISITGVDEGGGGAVKLSIEYPDKFVSVSTINGSFYHKGRFVKEEFTIGEKVPFPFKTRILLSSRGKKGVPDTFSERSKELLEEKKIRISSYQKRSKSLYRYILTEFRKHADFHKTSMEFKKLDLKDGDKVNQLLVTCIKEGYKDIINDILMANIDVNIKDKNGNTPLITAAKYNMFDIAAILIDNGAKTDLKDNFGRTPLIHAAIKGHNEILNLLIRMGSDVNTSDLGNSSALLYASRNKDQKTCEILIQNGAEINILNNDRVSPLMEAVKYDRIKTVEVLLKNGADINEKDNLGWTSLMKSSLQDFYDMTNLLINRGASLNTRDKDGRTPLMAAAWKGNINIVKLLVSKGADIKLGDNDGETPLIKSVKYNKKDVAKFLLSKGSDVNEADKSKATPLIHSAKSGLYHMAKILIASGAELEKKYRGDWTPLQMASMKGHKRVVELLVKKGAKIDAVSSSTGKSALIYATGEAHEEIVKMLLKNGADSNIVDNEGKSALCYAIINNLKKIAELIIVEGKTPDERNMKEVLSVLKYSDMKDIPSLIETVKKIREGDQKLKNKEFKEALKKYQEAYDSEKEKNRTTLVPDILSALARCFFEMKDYEKTIELYRKTMDYPERAELIAENFNEIGKTFYTNRKYSSAVNFLTGSLMISEEIDSGKWSPDGSRDRLCILSLKRNSDFSETKLEKLDSKRIRCTQKHLRRILVWDELSKMRHGIDDNTIMLLYTNNPDYDTRILLTRDDLYLRDGSGIFRKAEKTGYEKYKNSFFKKLGESKKRSKLAMKKSDQFKKRFNRLFELNYNLNVDPKLESSDDAKKIGKIFFESMKG